MPPWMPRSSRSSPAPSRCSSSRASSCGTSVKTATVRLELQDVPVPRAARFRAATAILRGTVARQVGRLDLVLGQAGLGLHRDAFGLAADADFLDARPRILVHQPLDPLVAAAGRGVV